MTNESIIAHVVADPLVWQSNTKRGPGGETIPPSTAQLQSMAAAGLQAVIEELLLKPAFERALLERTYELTTTTATEYTMPPKVGRILNIKNGSDGRPVRLFNSRTDFDDWKWREHGDTDLSDDEPLAAYVSGRGPNQQVKITFYPGVGSETTFDILHTNRLTPPYQVDAIFVQGTHIAVLLGVLDFATAGAYGQRFAQAAGRAAHNVNPIAGGMSRLKDGRHVRKMKKRWQNVYSQSLSYLWSVKD